MNIWGALIGGGIGLLRGAYTHSSDLKKLKRYRDRAEQNLADLPKEQAESARLENQAYLRSLQNALSGQQVGAGSAGLATLRNQAEAKAQGLADLGLGRRQAFEAEKKHLSQVAEDAQADVRNMRDFSSHLDYGMKYLARGAAIGATSGQAAMGDKGAANWEADSKEYAAQLKAMEDGQAFQLQQPALGESAGLYQQAPAPTLGMTDTGAISGNYAPAYGAGQPMQLQQPALLKQQPGGGQQQAQMPMGAPQLQTGVMPTGAPASYAESQGLPGASPLTSALHRTRLRQLGRVR